jgi:hypothetical protein
MRRSWSSAGGLSWFTEYNVLTGLSVRSTALAESVTGPPLAGRGLPYACGLRLHDLQPYSRFGARRPRLHTTTGIEHFSMPAAHRPADTDEFHYDHAAHGIAQEHGNGPVRVRSSVANHFPGTTATVLSSAR